MCGLGCGGVRSACPALCLPGHGYRVARPRRVCGGDWPIQRAVLPAGSWKAFRDLTALGQEVSVECLMGTSLLHRFFGTRAVLTLSETPTPVPGELPPRGRRTHALEQLRMPGPVLVPCRCVCCLSLCRVSFSEMWVIIVSAS